MASTSSAKTKVVIVGAGCVGMSTAIWMLEDGKYDVTMLDKCPVLPAPDAATTDINKIVRGGDYADPFLARLSVEAIDFWKKPEWEGCYHESGIVCLSTVPGHKGHDYVQQSFQNCKDMDLGAKQFTSVAQTKHIFHPELKLGGFGGGNGYHNRAAGWGESGRSVEVGLRRVERMGGIIRPGCEVAGLEKAQGSNKVTGVTLKSGETVKADLVVLAAGAWTPFLCASPQVQLRLPPISATGQSVAFVQLTPEEYPIYQNNPVVFNLDNGFYIFPPTADGVVKMAIHSVGHTNEKPVDQAGADKVSVPRTKLSDGASGAAIPLDQLRKIRTYVADIYPDLAKKPFIDTRLCWYCDTVTGDWLIDYHPDYENVVLATGDSGHGFKFAPTMGREILAIIERRADPAFADRLSFAPSQPAGADVRFGVKADLSVTQMCVESDLQTRAKL